MYMTFYPWNYSQIPPGYPGNVSYTQEVTIPDFKQEPGPPVITNTEYLQAKLKQYIGYTVRVEFLIGTNVLTDRLGTLREVGVNYIILQPPESDDLIVADLYSIKFVTVVR